MTISRFASVCGSESRTSLNAASTLIQRRRAPAADRCAAPASCSADCDGDDVQVARPLLDRVTGVHLTVQDRRRVRDDVVDLRQVLLETLGEVRRAVHQPLQRRTQSADRLRRLGQQRVDLLLGQHRQTAVGRVQRRTDLAGHRAVGDRLPVAEVLARRCRSTPGRGTARRSPTPSARWPSRRPGSCSGCRCSSSPWRRSRSARPR